MDQLGNLNYDIDLNKINIEKSKEFLFFDIIQEEGQGLFVPSGWHHQVWNLVSTKRKLKRIIFNKILNIICFS